MTETNSNGVTQFLAVWGAILSTITLVWNILRAVRRGTVKMTQPTMIFFSQGGMDGPTISLYTLLYATAQRGRIIENMFLKATRQGASTVFSVWAARDQGAIDKGRGLFVGEEGASREQRFILSPREREGYHFTEGEYILEVYTSLVGDKHPLLLKRVNLRLGFQEAFALQALQANVVSVLFDLEPGSLNYTCHLGPGTV